MNLPKETEINRFIPKEKIYLKSGIDSKLKQLFIDEVEKITWKNKISPDTLNISPGTFLEIEVFEIQIKKEELSHNVLSIIDKFILYPILFIIKKDNMKKAMMSYKESNQKNENLMKVDKFYETNWKEQIDLQLIGFNVDEIYKNFILQINPELKKINTNKLKDTIQTDKEIQKIQNQIDKLNLKIRREVSIAKKQELARERYSLEQKLKSF